MISVDDLKLEEKFKREELIGVLKWFIASLVPFLIFPIFFVLNLYTDLHLKNESLEKLTIFLQTEGESDKSYTILPKQDLLIKNAVNSQKNNFVYVKNEKNEYILTFQMDKALIDRFTYYSYFRKTPYLVVIPERKYWYMNYE